MDKLFAMIDRRIALSTDTDVDLGRKRTMLVGRMMGVPVGILYGTVFLYQRHLWVAAIAFGYALYQTLNTIHLFRSKRFLVLAPLTIGINMGAGFVGQILLGGFVQSGAFSMIASIGPISALLGLGRRAGLRAFIVFLLMEVGLACFDPQIRAGRPAVPQGLSFALLIINVAIVSIVVFTLTVLMVSELNDARSRADGLLLNILPGPIAERLKRNPEIIADRFDEVTILFADIVDFTRLSAGADPREVVTMLNNIFSDFDTLALKHGLEKIKTIGDAYMLAGGLPFERPDHAVAVVEFAMDMLKALETRRTWNDQPIRVRIGINTGPVVAGVIGKHKFIYDLWGDAVNTASRMESCGLSNTIQVTESTYQRLKDRYQFEERGVVNIKGKGEMTTYLLRGRKSAAGGDHHPIPAA